MRTSDKKSVSIHWGDSNLYIIETSGSTPLRTLNIPLKSEGNTEDKGFETALSKSMRLSSKIQSFFQDKKLHTNNIKLTLPARDIIFRSFIIPWMPYSEIDGAVSFEAKKYIPFPIDDLAFSFHPVTLTENGSKKIRIILTAVKTSTLEKYSKTIEQAGLTISAVEAAPISLARTLSFKNFIDQNKVCAIIEKEEGLGRITIVSKGIPQFVREFQLHPPLIDHEETSPADSINRAINEIRISLDYFSRHENQQKVEKLVIIGSEVNDSLNERVRSDLDIESESINVETFLGSSAQNNPNYLMAFGIALNDTVKSPPNFNLIRREDSLMIGNVPLNINKDISYKNIVIAVAACAAILFLLFLGSKNSNRLYKGKIASLNKELGIYKDFSIKKLEEKNKQKEDTLRSITSVPIKTQIHQYLDRIPRLLPDGVWFEDISIGFEAITTDGQSSRIRNSRGPSYPAIIVNGYAYLEDRQQQFTLVNSLLASFKKDAILSEAFKKISLDDITAAKFNRFDVTSFKISFR